MPNLADQFDGLFFNKNTYDVILTSLNAVQGIILCHTANHFHLHDLIFMSKVGNCLRVCEQSRYAGSELGRARVWGAK